MVRRKFRSKQYRSVSSTVVQFFPVVLKLSVNMVGAERLLTVTLAWLFMSVKTSGAMVADAASRSVNSSSTIQARDSEQWENRTTLDCPCNLNQCERFCCPWGHAYALDLNDCVEDTLTPRARDLEGSIGNHLVVTRLLYNCGGYMYRIHMQDRPICVGKSKRYLHNFADNCLYRELNTTNYKFLGCTWHRLPEDSSTDKDYLVVIWLYACMGLASLVALATFIVYSLVPELNNFQGQIVRSYLAGYFISMILVIVESILMLSESMPADYTLGTGLILLYFGYACLLWLNVMSFDIWKTFRNIRSSQAVNVKDRQRATFLRYSIYAWGTPVLLIFIFAAILVWTKTPRLEFVVLPLPGFVISVSNTCFYVLTALKIKRCKKETAQVVDAASKHHQKQEQRFNLYLKLFILMGCPVILWTLIYAVRTPIYGLVVVSVEPLQAISVFYMFVWKDDVKRSIRKRFADMMRRLGSINLSVYLLDERV